MMSSLEMDQAILIERAWTGHTADSKVLCLLLHDGDCLIYAKSCSSQASLLHGLWQKSDEKNWSPWKNWKSDTWMQFWGKQNYDQLMEFSQMSLVFDDNLLVVFAHTNMDEICSHSACKTDIVFSS